MKKKEFVQQICAKIAFKGYFIRGNRYITSGRVLCYSQTNRMVRRGDIAFNTYFDNRMFLKQTFN